MMRNEISAHRGLSATTQESEQEQGMSKSLCLTLRQPASEEFGKQELASTFIPSPHAIRVLWWC